MKDSFQLSLSLHKYLIEKLAVYREYDAWVRGNNNDDVEDDGDNSNNAGT